MTNAQGSIALPACRTMRQKSQMGAQLIGPHRAHRAGGLELETFRQVPKRKSFKPFPECFQRQRLIISRWKTALAGRAYRSLCSRRWERLR
jgi:hypothetical protein